MCLETIGLTKNCIFYISNHETKQNEVQLKENGSSEE